MKVDISAAALTEALIERGLVPERVAPFALASTERPWFISLVLGLAGWLAGLFSLLFVGVLFKPDSGADFSLVGVVMLAAAYGLYAVDRESAFFDQLALALSIAGQMALSVAAWELTESAGGTAALIAIMQSALLLVMPNRFAKLLAAFFACVAWALAVRFAWWGEWSFDREGSAMDGKPMAQGRKTGAHRNYIELGSRHLGVRTSRQPAILGATWPVIYKLADALALARRGCSVVRLHERISIAASWAPWIHNCGCAATSSAVLFFAWNDTADEIFHHARGRRRIADCDNAAK